MSLFFGDEYHLGGDSGKLRPVKTAKQVDNPETAEIKQVFHFITEEITHGECLNQPFCPAIGVGDIVNQLDIVILLVAVEGGYPAGTPKGPAIGQSEFGEVFLFGGKFGVMKCLGTWMKDIDY